MPASILHPSAYSPPPTPRRTSSADTWISLAFSSASCRMKRHMFSIWCCTCAGVACARARACVHALAQVRACALAARDGLRVRRACVCVWARVCLRLHARAWARARAWVRVLARMHARAHLILVHGWSQGWLSHGRRPPPLQAQMDEHCGRAQCGFSFERSLHAPHACTERGAAACSPAGAREGTRHPWNGSAHPPAHAHAHAMPPATDTVQPTGTSSAQPPASQAPLPLEGKTIRVGVGAYARTRAQCCRICSCMHGRMHARTSAQRGTEGCACMAAPCMRTSMRAHMHTYPHARMHEAHHHARTPRARRL